METVRTKKNLFNLISSHLVTLDSAPGMETARTKVENLFTTISSHMITLDGAPGTTPEYMATLRQFKAALGEHTDITREIIPLEKGENNPTLRVFLSWALVKSQQTDILIVNFIKNYCDGEGHPGSLVTSRMVANYVTDQIVSSTKILETMVHRYKKINDRL